MKFRKGFKTMKRILSLVICIALIMSVLPLTTFAVDIVESGQCGDNLTWELDSEGTLTISGTGDMHDYSDTPDNFTPWFENRGLIKTINICNGVTSIGSHAFMSCTELSSVSIPNSLTTIGSDAFNWCTSIENITIPNNVVVVGDRAFDGCLSLANISLSNSLVEIGINPFGDTAYSNDIANWEDNVLYIEKYLICATSAVNANYTIKSGTTLIAPYAFSDCNELKSVIIPDSVKSIGEYAFGGCTELTNIDIGTGVISIDDGAFTNCTKLEQIVIPNNVTNIGNSAFYGCTNISNVTLGENVVSIGGGAFGSCTNISNIIWNAKDVSIPIGYGGIFGDSGSEAGASVVFGDNVNNIPGHVFSGSNISNVKIGKNITSIGEYAFWSCSNLKNITIPDSVTTIGFAAFEYCSNLTDITIGKNVTTINRLAFGNCVSLERINWNAKNVTDFVAETEAFINAGQNGDGISLVFGDEVNKIPAYAFAELNLGSSYYPKLKRITLGNNGVTHIGKYSFKGCSELTDIVFGNSEITIDEGAFLYCYNIENIYAFDIENWCNFEYASSISTPSPGKMLYINNELATNITIPDSITKINSNIFAGCTSLTDITIPDSITSIGEYAFYYCSSLENIYYTGTQEQWNNISIDTNSGIDENKLHFLGEDTDTDSSTETKTIGGTLRTDDKWTIDWHCAYKENESGNLSDGKLSISVVVTSVNGSSSEEDIYIYNENGENEYEFPWESYENLNLKDIITRIEIKGQSGYNLHIIADMFKNYTSLERVDCSYVSGIDGNAFENCSKLKMVTISNSGRFSGFGSKSFRNCTSLSYVDFPESTKHINDFAFQNTALTNIYLGENVIEIGDSAFEGCTNLTNVEFPVDLQTIGDNAFKNTNIGIITLYEMIETIGNNAFSECENIFIKCYKNSVAHSYAIDNNIPFGFYNSITDIYYTDSNGVYQTETLPWSLENLISQTSSTTYSPEIAYMLAALSMAAYDEYNVSRSMHSLGMTNTVSRYSTDSIIDYSFGQLKMLDGRKLVLVDIQGTKGELNIFNLPTQWGSNFTLGGALFGASMHQGFEEALNVVYSDLASYLGSDFSNTVFVTTGHSRGAAISNLLAVKLTSVGVSGSNIYSYNFACPDVAAASGYQWNPNGKYNNIINIGHAGDPVAVLPGKVGNLFQLGSFFSSQWGKFGRSYWYAFDWHNPGELMLDLSFGAHNMELYLQYMRYRNSLSSYKTWEETQSVWTLPLGLLFGIACPVDVTVTDENGTIVASVIDGVVDYHGNTNGNVLIMTDGDEKIIYVKGNQALTVNLVATSEGTMNYTVAAIDDSGLVTSEKTFENVALTTGKEMKSDVNATDNGSTPDMSDVPLYVVDNEGDIVKEVLPDGTGTEVELKTITFDANGGSVSTATAKTNAEGKLSSLPTPTRSSYDFDGWYTSSTNGDKITNDTVFTQDTTVYAHWTKSSSGGSTGGGGGGALSEYTIKFETNGGNEITAVKVSKNNTITAPATPTKEGYIFDGWYTDKELSTKYDFAEKVTKSFTLYAKWVESTNDNTEWVNSFNDVNENDWYYETVRAICEQGLMKGVSDTEFAPNDNITRGMFVTLLYRAENEPVAPKLNFNDVPSGQYYTEAIAWASANNIVSGISDTEFAPNNNITREQIATILHRYAQYKNYDVSVGEDTNILSYNDADKMSEYAIPALQWAIGSGIISGKGNGILDPTGNATRAETATMMIRFLNTIK